MVQVDGISLYMHEMKRALMTTAVSFCSSADTEARCKKRIVHESHVNTEDCFNLKLLLLQQEENSTY